MFCGKCGIELEDLDKFCPNCGAPVIRHYEEEEAADPAEVQDAHEVQNVHEVQDVEIVSVPVSPEAGYRIDPNERHELIFLTREEAAGGCRKTLEIDGQVLNIDIPAGYSTDDAMCIKGYGYRDRETGEAGDLKVQFIID